MTSGDKQRRPEDHSSLPCGLACGYRSNGKYEHKNLLLDMRQKLFVVIFFSFLLETSTFVEGFLSSAYQKFTKQVATLHMKERYYHEPDESDDRFSSNDEDLFHDLMACRSHSEDIGNSTKFNHVRGPASLLSPESVIPAIMNALKRNDEPHKDAGLTMVWEFTTETTKYVFKNVTEFIESCQNTAEEFPTSFYGVAMNGQSWDLETNLRRVGGTDGWIATQIMKTISSDGRLRRWQWELRKNRRPPCLGCWNVESIRSSDRHGHFESMDRGDGWSD
ncbi:hypothetical protein ACHAXS_008213 [Conticribra weissflogii]